MPTEKPRFSITMDQELLSMVNDYQHKNRMSTQTKAVIDLIRKGLAQAGSCSQAALDVAAKYDRLDAHGRAVIDVLLTLELQRSTSLK